MDRLTRIVIVLIFRSTANTVCIFFIDNFRTCFDMLLYYLQADELAAC